MPKLKHGTPTGQLNRLFTATGRFSRLSFFEVLAGNFVLGVMGAEFLDRGGTVLQGVLWFAILVLNVWTNLVAVIKRWHDMDRTGWLCLLLLIPLLNLVVLAVLFAQKGTDGQNPYGEPDPGWWPLGA